MRTAFPRSAMASVAIVLLLVPGCRTEHLMGPLLPDPVADLGSQAVTLSAGASPAEYMAVISNTILDGTSSSSYSIRGNGLAASTSLVGAGPLAAPSLSRLPALSMSPEAERDGGFEGRLRATERRELTSRIAGAQAWHAAREARMSVGGGSVQSPQGRSNAAIPAGAKEGDVVRVNVQGDSACTFPTYHGARIMVISQRAMILEDTLNPKGGFSVADYRRFAARFDTLVFPLDSAAFGAPTDIDKNGHIALIFTRAVNEQTPRNSSYYIGGFTFSRDLFPLTATARTDACAGSNEGEYFYLLAPDPFGQINGNARTTSFVDSISTSIIAHEFQHLINAGRRLYVNNAPHFESKWLDEGLAHIAEELLFYRESGLRPRTNIGAPALRSTNSILFAYNRDMSPNQGRYRNFLDATSRSTPVGPTDDLPTRGAAWSLLRYLADRNASEDGDVFFRLVNNQTVGVENLVGVFGAGVATEVRDWNVSHTADDVVPVTAFQQPSWNWHSIYPAVSPDPYPLRYQPMASGTTYSGSVLSGGAAFYKLTVPANTSVTISFTANGATSSLSLVTVRTK